MKKMMLGRFRWVAGVLAAALLLTAFTGAAMADTVKLKDGTVIEGKIIREGDTWLQITQKIGSIEHTQLVMKDKVESIERDSDATPKAEPAKAEEPTPSAKPRGTATRVAILNFGPPSDWNGECGDTVGIEIAAEAFEKAIPMLEADHTDVVVIRINSGGGYLLEIPKFHKLWEDKYKKKFRTVGWVESAISAAAMSPYPLEEFYFMTKGNLGACTGWSGQLVAVKGWDLERVLALMEDASRAGNRDPKIMRAMQITDPLSADINKQTGEVTFRQDEGGEIVLNPEGQILTLTAPVAERIKFSRGTADTPAELASAMGLEEVEWVGQRASKYIDDFMRSVDRTEKQLQAVFAKYQIAVELAQSAPDQERRTMQVGIARQYLHQIRSWVKVSKNFEWQLGINDEWFEVQEELLRDLL